MVGLLFANLILALVVGGGIWMAARPRRRTRTPATRARH